MMLWSEDNDKPAYAAEYFPHEQPLEDPPAWVMEEDPWQYIPVVATRSYRRLKQLTEGVA